MSTTNNSPKNIYGPSSADGQTTVMVCAFEGWNDAGSAATEAVSLVESALDTEELSGFETQEFYDLTQTRPQLISHDDGSGELTWPQISVVEARLPENGLRLLLVTGPEPHFRWQAFIKELFALARRHDVKHLLLLGALLAETPHTRDFPVSVTSYTGSLQALAGIDQQTYTGPTGIVGALAYYAGQAGLTDVSVWVSVPHYVGHPPHPKATYALLLFLEAALDISLPLQPLEEETQAWERGASELMREEPELAEYVSQLEAEADSSSLDSISGDELAEELERFLKRRDR